MQKPQTAQMNPANLANQQSNPTQPTNPAQNQMQAPIQPMGELAKLMQNLGLTQQAVIEILTALNQQQSQNRHRAEMVLQAVQAIGDQGFTIQTIRANPQALQALEEGMSAGEVYKKFFLKRPTQVKNELDANIGLNQLDYSNLSKEQIERISQYVDSTGNVYRV